MRQKSFYLLLLLATIFTWSCQKEADVFAPVISGAEVDTVLNIGDKLVLAPNITNLVGVGYTWLVNGKEVASGQTDYTFIATEPGDFVVIFRAGNKGGTGEQAFKIMVEKPIAITLENELTIPMSQVLDIEPTIDGPERNDYEYEWAIGDSIIGQTATLPFISVSPGDYTLTLTATAGRQSTSASCDVKVEEAEYTGYVTSLLEYQPSYANRSSYNWLRPFFNQAEEFSYPHDEYTQALSERINEQRFHQLGLGWWGGYAVFGFNHTVANVPGKNDIQLYIQAHYPSETAYFVAYDKNKNGKPDDDEWYEIKSDNYGKEAIKEYELTFAVEVIDLDNGNKKIIQKWTDNQGMKEEVIHDDVLPANTARLVPGGYYENGIVKMYDGWENSYTLKGRLMNVQIPRANQRRVTEYINIGDAIDAEGNPVHLPGIDFLKVQNITIEYFQQNIEPMISINKRVSAIKNNHL